MYTPVLHRGVHTNKRSSVVTCNQIAYTNEVSSLQSAGVKSVHLVWRERLGCFAFSGELSIEGGVFQGDWSSREEETFGPQSG
jgi:hypothetical protein